MKGSCMLEGGEIGGIGSGKGGAGVWGCLGLSKQGRRKEEGETVEDKIIESERGIVPPQEKARYK